jgi:glutaredoxin 3
MSTHTIEIYSAGCPVCEDTVKLVNQAASPGCEITVLDMNDGKTAARAKALGIGRVPAVVIDGKLAGCCVAGAPDTAAIQKALV